MIKFVSLYDVKFVVICEPKLYVSKIDSIHLRLSFDLVVINISGDLWVFYSSPFIYSIVDN